MTSAASVDALVAPVVDQPRVDQMVTQQVRAWQVHDEDILSVLRQVPRAAFLPANLRAFACADTDLPMDQGQMMLAPKLEGRILQAVQPTARDRVVVIGAANAHLAACLCRLSSQVALLDSNAALLETARQQTLSTGVNNLLVINDHPGAWRNDQSVEIVIITGGVAQVPPGLEHSLTVGGRLFAVVGVGVTMNAVLVRRTGANQWQTQSLFETVLPILSDTAHAADFVF